MSSAPAGRSSGSRHPSLHFVTLQEPGAAPKRGNRGSRVTQRGQGQPQSPQPSPRRIVPSPRAQVRKSTPSLQVLSCPVVSCPVMSCRVQLCPVMSSRVLSCPVVSCHVQSYPVMSCRVQSCSVLSCPVVSTRVQSSPVMTRWFPGAGAGGTQLELLCGHWKGEHIVPLPAVCRPWPGSASPRSVTRWWHLAAQLGGHLVSRVGKTMTAGHGDTAPGPH